MATDILYGMYYIAIVCPEAINEKVLKYKLWMQQNFDCKVALKSPAHITLVAPFYFEEGKEKDLLQSFQSFSAGLNSIIIELSGFSHYGKRVIFIKVNENDLLELIYKKAISHFYRMLPKIAKEDDRSFSPHVTIANRDVKPSAFIKAWQYFSNKKFEMTFETNSISLLKLTEGKWKIIADRPW
ncbi:MAG TPA: 2'-5' RNA ligase family protein [Chitinophagaceae bacterium]|nr:2'-5' RNA ligase family protein [Chitinophagaceae bacterium]